MIHEIIVEIEDKHFREYGLEGCREIVRCKDCKHWDDNACFVDAIEGMAEDIILDRFANDYCSRAERKEE